MEAASHLKATCIIAQYKNKLTFCTQEIKCSFLTSHDRYMMTQKAHCLHVYADNAKPVISFLGC